MQKGFSPILTVLFLGVLIIAGFIAWRVWESNQHKPTDQNHSSQQIDPNAGYMVIKEWGVRFKPMGTLSELIYSIKNEGVVFSTQPLAAFAPSCGTGVESNNPLGLLTRTQAASTEYSSKNGSFVKRIYDYYYAYTTPQAACFNDLGAANLPTVPLEEFKTSIATLEAAK